MNGYENRIKLLTCRPSVSYEATCHACVHAAGFGIGIGVEIDPFDKIGSLSAQLTMRVGAYKANQSRHTYFFQKDFGKTVDFKGAV